ncbi:MAG: SsrA-binding protein SmpB [Candidatus Marinimicrobia bacterium]|jgi:SsrA-binding protein|nr:SsrA-binding protein SmpB [Candidatus Neomarinimicrobiota bacterium]MDP6568220.1 SsrA-binding protein SmpB [Candidatus Neomarinimicrobiota bacterium]MDP7025486.1 SsrA-binding protein SmpB [Candidatus Neomarinimicrobiota bacterium]|tara:strand:- start:2013 stop:2513 length:501 start_codon:yes stop_codon:yes gene_type:complete
MLVTDAVLQLFSPSRMNDDIRVVTTNRKAFHDYHILDRFEAGLELVGTEVKSLREGRANLKDAYAKMKNGELYLIGCHIGPYSHTGFSGHEPYRDRRLLLNKREIRKLDRSVTVKNHTIIPLKMYFKKGWAKVEIALAKGKRSYDKKAAIAEKDRKRALDRELSRR